MVNVIDGPVSEDFKLVRALVVVQSEDTDNGSNFCGVATYY